MSWLCGSEGSSVNTVLSFLQRKRKISMESGPLEEGQRSDQGQVEGHEKASEASSRSLKFEPIKGTRCVSVL